ncbi:MAG TPA: SUMF1/EgtB/PvdO family nonheme iron enzyme [Sedimentisphaerales bacterium]|nr:SUMF1/EgtB/PvdO family nonheme iron enzyme [Sedimentisphaerales bacterium]
MTRRIGMLVPVLAGCVLAICVVQAEAFFASTAKLRKSPLKMPAAKTFKNFIGMEFVRIEPGTFTTGFEGGEVSDEILTAAERVDNHIKLSVFGKKGDYDEHPAHKVTITMPFYIGVREVTNAEFEMFDPLHMHLRGKQGFSIDDAEAVVFVSWHEAKAFCDWLSEIDGLPYRLPTEAEWEYACRAGTATRFSTGDTLPDEFLKNPGSSWYPSPERGKGRNEVVPLYVGKTPPNPWGLYDMHGNVEEWCHDWYGPYEPGSQEDPVGRLDGDFKVARSGSHGTVAYYLRSANRMGALPEDKSFMIGFRVIIAELPDTTALPMVPKPLYQQNVRQDVTGDVLKGPDPDKPYFRGPRNYVKIEQPSYGPLFHRHNHDPGICECPNGDLLAIWYTCVSERGRELAMAASRLRRGADEWEPASPFWDAPDRNDHAPALWYDGDRTIYHFNGLSSAATWGNLAIVMRTSADNGVTWSRGRLIMPEHQRRQQVVESVFRTREGYLVLPCDASPSSSDGTAIHISKDNGLTWADAGGTIAGIHGGVTQLKDGRLMALGRGDAYDGRMTKSISNSMGKTWQYSPTGFPPVGGGQRLVLLRLKEGPIFLGSFANGDPPVMVTDASGKKREIKGFFGAVSYDEGVTWPVIRLITDDGPERQVKTTDGKPFAMSNSSAEPKGYFSVCQARNGIIHLISSWNHYAFNLKWLQTPPPQASGE